MVTNNYYKLVAYLAKNSGKYAAGKNQGLVDFTGNVSQKDSRGMSPQECFFTTNDQYGYSRLCFVSKEWNYYNSGIILGSGTTPATADDYCLENSLIDQNISSYTTTVTNIETANGTKTVILIQNVGSSSITIGEIGVWTPLDMNGGTPAGRCLLDRTVLSSPITIEAGGIGQIEYTISSSSPTV